MVRRWISGVAFLLMALAPAEEENPGAAFYGDLARFAETCAAKGLSMEARRCYQYLADARAQPYARQAADALAALPAAPAAESPASVRREMEAVLGRILEEGAERFWRLARRHQEEGEDEKAAKAIDTALAIWEDHPRARLWKGQARVEGLGWMEEGVAARFNADAVSLAKPPNILAIGREDPKHAAWDDAWILLTDHYTVRSNRPLAEVLECGRKAEAVYQAFFDFARGAVDRPAGRMGIHYFAGKEEYDRYLRERAKDAEFSMHNVEGFYDNTTRVSSFYAKKLRPPAGGEDETQERYGPDPKILFHESVHQLLDLAYDGKFASSVLFLKRPQNRQPCFWVVEGTSCFFEACEVQDGRLVPARASPRCRRAARQIARWKGSDFSDWLSMDQKRFMAEGQVSVHYDLAAAFVHFLANYAAGQKYRRSLFQFLAAHYRGEVGPETFQRMVKTRLDVLEGEFADYARQTWPEAAEEKE